MATKAAYKRLTKEYAAMQKEPPPFVWAAPDEKNILTWNFIIRGPSDSPYAGGEYHGVLMFPSEYPFKPPGIKASCLLWYNRDIDTNGWPHRCSPPPVASTLTRKSAFRCQIFILAPGIQLGVWQQCSLTGLLSFMLSDEMTTGSVTSTDAHKRAFAVRSHAHNIAQSRFRDAFPEYSDAQIRDLPNMGQRERGGASIVAAQQPPTSPPTTIAPIPATSAADPKAVSDSSSANAWTAASVGRVLWEKWRWGLLIALAVLVSRVSS
ncbi:UBC-like protein [Mycena indigotica]|uniref:UBC-like protein n=1 Tax=Mycena indigotica TaxID=2126181 RepID=A0A8H6W867_9AGAR|nr:UBC-like protein [Mycena indigotica]KAF7309374.1 UBC-like protein [Mycena indigotica]